MIMKKESQVLKKDDNIDPDLEPYEDLDPEDKDDV